MTESARRAAMDFVTANLASLASDVIHSRKAALPKASLVDDLATLCKAFVSQGDAYQEAERLIVNAALQAAAGHGAADVHVHPCADAEQEQGGYNRLLPKLLSLADTVDAMTDEAYTAWINTLPEDEFFAFIAVSHNHDSFQAALTEAKRRVEVDNDH